MKKLVPSFFGLLLSSSASLLGAQAFGPVAHQQSAVAQPRGEVQNLGLASDVYFSIDEHQAFFVWETAQGQSDLNGNGFTFDHVLHVRNGKTGVIRNLARSGNIFVRPGMEDFEAYGPLITFAVEETLEGDLNADADQDDQVLFVYDFDTDVLWNTGYALNSVISPHLSYYVAGDLVVGLVSEADQTNTDLNADGDVGDTVLHFFDPATQTVTNTGLALPPGYKNMDFDRTRLAASIYEADQGATDLNGDGDAADEVLHTFDLATLTAVNLGIATRDMDLAGDELLILVDEAKEGGLDRNGDGDATDGVAAVVHLATGAIVNLGLAGIFDLISVPGVTNHVDGTTGILRVSELFQGGTDLNGDSDASDAVLFRIDLPTATVVNTLLPATFARVESDLIVAHLREADGPVDLNGDPDTIDTVLFIEDVRAPGFVNTGLASVGPPLVAERGVAWLVDEISQNEVDLNGDGDHVDDVLHFYDRNTLAIVNPGTSASSPYRVDGKWVVYGVDEDDEGVDLNGDGDTGDEVTHVFDLNHHRTRNLGLTRFSGMDGNVVLGQIRESTVDLNADGGFADRVLHMAQLAPRRR